MKKEYIKPMIEMIDFQAKESIMTDNEDDAIYTKTPHVGDYNSFIEWWD